MIRGAFGITAGKSQFAASVEAVDGRREAVDGRREAVDGRREAVARKKSNWTGSCDSIIRM